MPSSTLRRARPLLYLIAAPSLCACVAALPHRIEPQPRGTAASAPPAAGAPAAAPAVAVAPDLPTNMPLPKLPAYSRPDDGPQPIDAALEQVRRAQQRTGLSDAQLARLQAGQDQIAAGDSASALTQLQALNAELAGEARSYTVQEGESLWHIAAHGEVYGNPYLWPLLWAANQRHVQKPYQVYKGLRLTVPLHPTVQEVSAALQYGKAHATEAKTPAEAKADAATDSKADAATAAAPAKP